MSLKKITVSSLCMVLIWAYACPGYALEANSSAPIEITSDTAEIDESSGTATYTGNVVISQGASELSAHTVTVKAVDRKLVHIEAEGSPARFKESSAESGNPSESATKNTFQNTKGRANIISYDASKLILTFSGNAKLEQDSNSFEGEEILYDINASAIKAQAGESSDSRVKIQYLPSPQPGDASKPSN